jgi:hypothetical protein
VFSLFVGLFSVIEHTIGGWLRGHGWGGGVRELLGQGKDELLAGCLVTLVAFIPFFAFRELGRVHGREELRRAFFRERPAMTSGLSR